MLPGMASRTQPPARQQAPAAVTLVVGEEEFLVDRAVRERIAAARAPAAGDDGGDLHDVEASTLTPGELATLTSPSLFGGGAIVIVRNAQNAGKEIAADLARYAKSPPPDATLVITHAGGAKGKALVADLTKAGASVTECPKLTRPSERAEFVQKRVPPGRPAGRRGRDAGAARRGGRRPQRTGVGGRPARLRHRRQDHRRRRGQVLPGTGGGDGLQRGRPRGRGTAERGAGAAPLGAGDRHRPGPDQQRARPGAAAARPGRRGAPGRERRWRSPPR